MSIPVRNSLSYFFLFLTAFSIFLCLCFSMNNSCSGASISDRAPAAGTPTPFLPLSSESDVPQLLIPPEALSRADFPESMNTASSPYPVEPLPLTPHTINILLTGSDTRPGFPGVRTDTIMILSLNQDRNTASVLSIPRDLYVHIPGFWMGRINTAEGLGDTQLLAETIQYNLGVTTHYYIKVDFSGFINIIDALGGIDLENDRSIHDTCDMKNVEFPAGSIHLDGENALCYARVRKTSSDFDRVQRQQHILAAAFRKATSLHSLTKIPDLYQAMSQYVETDIDVNTVLSLLSLAANLAGNPDQVRFFSISSDSVTGHTVPETGASVLLPEYEAVRQILYEVFDSG